MQTAPGTNKQAGRQLAGFKFFCEINGGVTGTYTVSWHGIELYLHGIIQHIKIAVNNINFIHYILCVRCTILILQVRHKTKHIQVTISVQFCEVLNRSVLTVFTTHSQGNFAVITTSGFYYICYTNITECVLFLYNALHVHYPLKAQTEDTDADIAMVNLFILLPPPHPTLPCFMITISIERPLYLC